MNEFLVFFETSGNQAYVYATNKLRENIGASELTYRAGTRWVLEAAGFNNVETDKPSKFREWLGGAPANEHVEVILCTSGKSLLVVKGRAKAEEIIAAVTTKAAKEAPGLCITGAIVDLVGRDKDSVKEAVKKAHKRFNANRDLMPTPAQRFQMLPFSEPCATSGLPASSFKEKKAYAESSLKKIKISGEWFKRIANVFQVRSVGEKLFISNSAEDVEKNFDDLAWLGVVFSDGNGLGQIVMKFDQWLDGADYLETLRKFSVELDTATEEAFFLAAKEIIGAAKEQDGGGKLLPLVPLLLGGDDVTVMVDGRYALPFAKAFLDAFEKETEKQPTLSKIAQKALGAGRLSAGAGVAIVKKHFPFHSAHGLADSLLKSAKTTKKHVVQGTANLPFPCSSLDFHILFDAAFSDLDDMRKKRRTAQSGEKLWGGPYVITPTEKLKGANATGWAEQHHIEHLKKQVSAMNAVDDAGRYKLPSSQTHMLREAVAAGKIVADARIREVMRLENMGLDALYEDTDGKSFFSSRDTDEKDKPIMSTRFLDALSSAEFWPQESNAKEQE